MQLPDGASLERTQQALDEVSRDCAAPRPASTRSSTIAGISALDNNATLANAGVAYIMLKDWSVRGEAHRIAAAVAQLNASSAPSTRA